MKSLRVALFGHYDSRGGTSVYILSSGDSEEIQRVKTDYDKQFGIDQDIESYKKDPSKWNWDPTEPESWPSHNDYLGTRVLYYPDDVTIEVGMDLESTGCVAACTSNSIILEYVPLEGGFWGWREDDDDVVRHQAMAEKLQIIDAEDAEISSWDDDAFGFLIVEIGGGV